MIVTVLTEECVEKVKQGSCCSFLVVLPSNEMPVRKFAGVRSSRRYDFEGRSFLCNAMHEQMEIFQTNIEYREHKVESISLSTSFAICCGKAKLLKR